MLPGHGERSWREGRQFVIKRCFCISAGWRRWFKAVFKKWCGFGMPSTSLKDPWGKELSVRERRFVGQGCKCWVGVRRQMVKERVLRANGTSGPPSLCGNSAGGTFSLKEHQAQQHLQHLVAWWLLDVPKPSSHMWLECKYHSVFKEPLLEMSNAELHSNFVL